jgi:hypothetical protein
MDRALNDAGVIFERDLAAPMRDGVHLSTNLFRPADGKPVPVIMSVTPYGKDKLPDRLATFFMRLTGVRFGDIKVSRYTGFEAPDPLYWVRNGYAVMLTDAGRFPRPASCRSISMPPRARFVSRRLRSLRRGEEIRRARPRGRLLRL